MRPFITVAPLALRHQGLGVEIDGVALAALRALVPTPFYVTSLSAVASRVRAYKHTLETFFPGGQVYYAMKANFAPAVLGEVKAADAGVDIVSIGEWRACLKSGVKAVDVCFAGVGKTRAQWREALQGGVGIINAEHADELTAVLDDIRDLGRAGGVGEPRTHVAVRLNPCVESDTHPHLKTGALDSKFGMLFEQVQAWVSERTGALGSPEAFARWAAPLKGIHVHIGSQLLNPEVFALVVEKVFACAAMLHASGLTLEHLDLGGGLGVGADGVPEDNADITTHVGFLCETVRRVGTRHPEFVALWGRELERLAVNLEPGRSVVASSTIMMTEVLYEKSNAEDVHFAYVDAGMNDFPRPAIYGARHGVFVADFASRFRAAAAATAAASAGNEPERASASGGKRYTVAGPVCESGDILARDANLPPVAPGDLIGFLEAGAYCRSMASHYNLRPLPAEIFVRDGRVEAIIPPIDP